MSQPQTVEAARARIQRLVDEIAALSKSDTRSEEYYPQFLSHAVTACDGKGGAIWLVGRTAEGKSEFQLAAQVDLESSLFQTDEQQRSILLRCLSEVVQSKKPMVLPAEGPAPGGEPGSLQAQLSQMAAPPPQQTPNRTPYPYIHVPLFLKEQVLGVLQVWLQPYVTRENYTEFATFLAQLAGHMEQHFQSRRMGNMVVENQRLQHLLKFNGDITGTLDPVEVARLTTNYSRDLLGCERCAVLRRRGAGWEMLSISGQEVVERKGSMVKSMTAFVTAHTPLDGLPFTPDGATVPDVRAHIIALGRKELLALADGRPEEVPEARTLVLRPHGDSTSEVDFNYFDLGQVASALIVQLLDGDKKVVGVLLAESSTENFFEVPAGAKEAPPSHRLSEWIAGQTGRAMRAALDHDDLPFLFISKRLRNIRRKVLGSGRSRYIFWRLFWLTLIAGVLFFPWMEEVESDCTLVPEKRVKIVPEVPGRIEKVLVREGQIVKQGDPIAQIETSALRAELSHTREELIAATAEAEKYRGMNDPASEQIAQTKVRANQHRVKRLEEDITSATLRAPMDGIVLTKDIELSEGVYVSAGADFAVIGTTDDWDLQVHIQEKQVGKVEKLFGKLPQNPPKKTAVPGDPRAVEEHGIPVHFILYSQNMSELKGYLTDMNQLSPVAYPHMRENAIQENAFVLTLHNVSAPEDIRRNFRPDLTGRASIQLGRRPLVMIWASDIANWVRLKWIW